MKLYRAGCFAVSSMLVAVALVVGVGCGGGGGIPSPPYATALVLSPGDVSTGSVPPLGIMVLAPATWAQLERTHDATTLLEATRLLTWPEGEVVPTTTEVHETAAQGFSLVPDGRLEERWYALEVSAPSFTGRDFLVDGSPITARVVRRFYNGSLPLVRAYGSMDDQETLRVGLSASEPIRLREGTESLASVVEISVSGVPVPCLLDEPSVYLADGMFEFVCDDDGSRELTIAVHPGIESMSGVALRDYQGREDAVLTWNPPVDGHLAPTELSEEVLAMHGPASDGT